MTSEREFNRIRWHGRVGFLATTLAVLVCLGGPILGARGMLEHGVLFLPALVGLIFLFGAPLLRLALALGQMNVNTPGEEALKPVQGVVRFVFLGLLLLTATHAATWIIASMAGDVPARVVQMQNAEIANYNGYWRLGSKWFMPAMGGVILTAALFWATVRRRGLAGLSWLGTPILVFFLAVIASGMLLVSGVPGFGALVAASVPVNWHALATLGFWGDAGSIALVAIGAQTGIVVAAGRGLPQRAKVGRESRLLVCFMAVVTVVSTLAALFLVCAMDLNLGLVPTPEHAASQAVLIDLVPAAGEFLVSGFPEDYRPSHELVTRGWCFAVFLVSTFGMLALAVSGDWLPRRKLERPALFGYLAAGVLATVIITQADAGSVWAVLSVAPALLAVLRMTLARRHGVGMKLAVTAFESAKGGLARLYLFFAFRVSRQLLLLMVLAVVFSDSSQGLVYAGLAVSFLLMWIGSLQMRRRESKRVTRIIPAPVALVVVLLIASSVHALDLVTPTPLTDRILNSSSSKSQAKILANISGGNTQLSAEQVEVIESRISGLQQMAKSGELDEAELMDARIASRRGLMALQANAPDDVGLLQVERDVLETDGVAPFTRLSEALIAMENGDREPAIEWAETASINWNSNKVLESARNHSSREFALVVTKELQTHYGVWGAGTRQLRGYLIGFAVDDRSLLRPVLGPGITMILTLLVAAAALVASMLLGLHQPRSLDLKAKTD